MAASDIRRQDVLDAIAEYERLGQSAFLIEYDHSEAKRFRLVYKGKFYDSKAVVGVAHGYATGEFWKKEDFSGGYGPGAAATVLRDLGFYVDDGTLFGIEKVHPDLSHGKRAPYQYVVLLWAFNRADGFWPRIVDFDEVREELARLLAPFKIGDKAPNPAMPWAALGNNEDLWELDRQGLTIVTEAEVKRLNLAGGLSAEAYEAARRTEGFMEVAAQVVGRFIGNDQDAFRRLLEELGFEGVSPWQLPAELWNADVALKEVAYPRRTFGRRLSAAANKVIEEHAIRVVRRYLEDELGYTTTDVGASRSYDVHAAKEGSFVMVEVKGTTSDGGLVLLTANEVELHRREHPNTALAVVRRIVLEDRTGENPVAKGGQLEFTMPWKPETEHLEPIAYRYTTGL